MPSIKALTVDIFCRVIDNFGDAGVCWRLARQLANEHACLVRLYLDQPQVLEALLALPLPAQGAKAEGVTILYWDDAAAASPAAMVIEAFACNPPDAYVAKMAALSKQPVWINLEYLSAEAWVEGSHLVPSRHPQLGLLKYFYFPGFSATTGGLLKEATLDETRRRFCLDPAAQEAFWHGCGVPPPQPGALSVSLFSYENAALPALLDVWAHGPSHIHCAVPTGRALPAIAAWAGETALAPGAVIERGRLRLAVLPFLRQIDYDRLLWACQLNFVRGEDSFVRAQWAQRPFVWHIYQQDDDAHRVKLEAFLDRYLESLDAASARPLREFWRAWDAQDAGANGIAARWPALLASLSGINEHAAGWAARLDAHGDLASRLLIFCTGLLE